MPLTASTILELTSAPDDVGWMSVLPESVGVRSGIGVESTAEVTSTAPLPSMGLPVLGAMEEDTAGRNSLFIAEKAGVSKSDDEATTRAVEEKSALITEAFLLGDGVGMRSNVMDSMATLADDVTKTSTVTSV